MSVEFSKNRQVRFFPSAIRFLAVGMGFLCKFTHPHIFLAPYVHFLVLACPLKKKKFRSPETIKKKKLVGFTHRVRHVRPKPDPNKLPPKKTCFILSIFHLFIHIFIISICLFGVTRWLFLFPKQALLEGVLPIC